MSKFIPGFAIALLFPIYYLMLQVSIEFELNPQAITYGSRGVALSLISLLFFYSLKDGKLKSKWNILHFSLLLFMALYAFRLFSLNDPLLWKLDNEMFSFNKVAMLFIFGSVVPFTMAMLSANIFGTASTSNIFIGITFFCVTAVALMNLDHFGVFRTRGYEAGTIHSLSMGYLAALAVGYCLLDLLRLRRFPFLLPLAVLIAAVFLLALSASRGPLVATAVSAIYIVFIMKKSTINIVVSMTVIGSFIFGALWFFEYSGSGILHRIDETGEDEGRNSIYSTAWEVVVDNIWFGKDVAVPSRGDNYTWPHNLALEALLAVGVFGLLFIWPWIFSVLKILVSARNENWLWLYVWFLQTSVMSLFTGAIWSGSSLFLCLCLVLSSSKEKITKKKKRRKQRKRRSEKTSEFTQVYN